MNARIIPLVILLILSGISVGVSIERHGKKKTGIESIWATLIAWLIQWGLILWMIW